MPNIKELQSLADYSTNTPAFAPGIPYSGDWADYPWDQYWSFISFSPVPEDYGWIFNSNFGQVEIRGKENVDYTWPIRVDR